MSDLKSMYSTVVKDGFPDTLTILLGDEKLVYEKRTWQIGDEAKGLRYGEIPTNLQLYMPSRRAA